MVLDFQKKLSEALESIGFAGEYHELLVQQEQEEIDVLEIYGNAQWQIVDLLNEKYNSVLMDKIDLHNWIDYNQKDEVAYFLSETGTNCLNYAEHRAPHKFHVWSGEKGFVVGVEQIGESFSAEMINEKRIKENEGAAFEFFRNCNSTIFFDNPKETRVVYMELKFGLKIKEEE